MSGGKLQVVVGGQFGSEAKGHVAHRLVRSELAQRQAVAVVRVGGPNAGHTVLDDSGVAWALRQVPVGAVSPAATLVIAQGSEVDPFVLMNEINQLELGGHQLHHRLWIDMRATLLEPRHLDTEAIDNTTARIGSTGKGIGAARADRLMRRAKTVGDSLTLMNWLSSRGIQVIENTDRMLQQQLQQGGTVVIEGTQGFGLGLHAGYYPYATSGNCRAVDFIAQTGLSPWNADEIEVWVVVRPFPIRVAGNSGPLYKETTWAQLGLDPEYTTVTKKMRRVGQWDSDLVRAAIWANGGRDNVKIAFTMADQVVPGVADITRAGVVTPEDWEGLESWIRTIEDCGAPVKMITTGPNSGWVYV